MIIKSRTTAAVVGAAVAWTVVPHQSSAWSFTPLQCRSNSDSRYFRYKYYSNSRFSSELRAAPDSPLFSDDLTSKTYHGPNPQNLKIKEAMLRQAYDDWRAKYGRGEYDKDRFRIFKFNFLASQRAHELQTARAKMDGKPLPQMLELNAYGDCTREEYLQLKDQESRNLITPRALQDGTSNTTSVETVTVTVTMTTTTTTANVTTAETTVEAANVTEPTLKKPHSLQVDDRGPEIERKATMFPQRSTESLPSMTPLSPMKPKMPPTMRIQDQLEDLKKATENLAPQPGKKSSQFTGVGTASQVPPRPNSSFIKPDEKGVFPDRSPSFLQHKTAAIPKVAAKSDQENKQIVPVNPNIRASFVPPDQQGIFGDKSATTFPKRNESHALPQVTRAVSPATLPPVEVTPTPSQSDTSATPDAMPPKIVPSDQEKRDITNIHPDSLHLTPPATFPKISSDIQSDSQKTVASARQTDSSTTENTKAVTTASTPQPDTANEKSNLVNTQDKKEIAKINPGSSYVRPDLRGSFTERSAKYFPKRTEVYNVAKKLTESDSRPAPSVSFIKPDVFYKEQSALTFPKRTEAHSVPKIAAQNSESQAKPEALSNAENTLPDNSSKDEITQGATPSASTVKPDLFFQERSASTFPKRTDDHNSNRPPIQSKTKTSPSLSYIKPDFIYPERSATSFTKRSEPNDALVKASMFRDDVPAQSKNLLPDQRRANIADPFSFTKKKRDDLPPPDFNGPKQEMFGADTAMNPSESTEAKSEPKVETNFVNAEDMLPNETLHTTNAEMAVSPKEPESAQSKVDSTVDNVETTSNEMTMPLQEPTKVDTGTMLPNDNLQTSSAEITVPLEASNTVESEQTKTETTIFNLDNTLLEPKGSKRASPKSETRTDKPEVQVSVPDLTSIQLKLGKSETKEQISLATDASKTTKAAPVMPVPKETSRGKQTTPTSVANKSQDSKAAQKAQQAEPQTKPKKEKSGLQEDKNERVPLSHINGSLETEQVSGELKGTFRPPKSQESMEDTIQAKEMFQISETNVESSKKPISEHPTVQPPTGEMTTPASISTNDIQDRKPDKVAEKRDAGIDAAARQQEIENALKADFSQATSKSANADFEKQRLIEAIFEGKVPSSLSSSKKTIQEPISKSSTSPNVNGSLAVDPIARQKEIEEALKADFSAAAKTVDQQQRVEAVFEGKLQVKSKRAAVEMEDPFAVNSPPRASPVSVEDVLKAEMNAAKSLKTNQAKSSNSAEEALLSPKTVSIHDILKEEMEAAKRLKKSVGTNSALSQQPQDISLKSDEIIRNGGITKRNAESIGEAQDTSSEDQKKQKRKRKWKRNKNKSKPTEDNKNDSSTTQRSSKKNDQ